MEKIVIVQNNLAVTHPELAAEWHPTKNGVVTPQDVTKGSGKIIYWQCKAGHEWKSRIIDRSLRGTVCSDCRKISYLRENNLVITHPGLAAEWHPTKNGTIVPQDVLRSSELVIHWQCAAGHEWKAKIYHRVAGGSRCPDCKKISYLRENSIGNNPELDAEWHPTKNGTITPQISPRGHHIPVGKDLAITHPRLAAEWHPTKNNGLTPQGVTRGSKRKVHWQCAAGHEWEATIKDRSDGNGCSACGKISYLRENNLATIHPELAAEWHPTKNNGLTPQGVLRSSELVIHWQCAAGHEWEAKIYHRVARESGCAACAKIDYLKENNLGVTHPELTAEWHPTKNNGLTPQDVLRSSEALIHWQCTAGHEWKAKIYRRVAEKGVCPECSGGAVTEKKFRETFEEFSKFNFKPDRIHLIRLSRKTNRAQIDMINDRLMLVIEYDGAWTHGENTLYKTTLAQKLADDKETTEALIKAGYNVIRIRNHDESHKLPFVPVTPTYASKVYQITYKSFGKDRDTIDNIVKIIIEEKAEWFRVSDG